MTSTPYAVLKWVLIALALAAVFWVATQLVIQGQMIAVTLVAFIGLAILAVYATKRAVPLKYLLPGILALLALQVWPIILTIAMSFTNYGDGHLGTKQEAVDQIVATSVKQVEGSKRYNASIAVKEGQPAATGDLVLLLTDPDGKFLVATQDGVTDLPAGDVEKGVTGGIKTAKGYTVLTAREANARSKELGDLAFKAGDGKGIKLLGLSQAFEGAPTVTYDAAKDTLTTADGRTFAPANGRFTNVADPGDYFSQGWMENVGMANYSRVFTDPTIRSAFFATFIWNIVFALLTVAGTFLLGMLIALLFNDPRLKGKWLYRSLLVLPYAIPTFVTALLWRGMFNQDYGLINTTLGLNINWLGDDWAARAAVIITNLWLGFPYMFLVCTGALQAIPADVKEAAKIDGASGFRTLTSITMPLLLVAVGPLLVASYAFNFNNFSLIYLLTEGGPFRGGNTDFGATDLLITVAYRVAFTGAAPNFGFAAAVSVIIFILVALMTIPTFRGTKALEEIN